VSAAAGFCTALGIDNSADCTGASWHFVVEAAEACMRAPLDALHPASLGTLSLWWKGIFNDDTLRIAFPLPNSRYLDVADCIVSQVLAGGWPI
jgi:hypothetical protein